MSLYYQKNKTKDVSPLRQKKLFGLFVHIKNKPLTKVYRSRSLTITLQKQDENWRSESYSPVDTHTNKFIIWWDNYVYVFIDNSYFRIFPVSYIDKCYAET